MEDMNYWYEIHGEGVPVVLLHGFTGSTLTWDKVVTARPDGMQLITVDLPGHGWTKGTSRITMDSCIDDLHGLFQHLELDTFFLVGYSMGGRTALSYTVKYPESVRGLILESASPGLKDTKARKNREAGDEELAKLLEEEGIESFVDYWENIPLFATQKELPDETQAAIRAERMSQSKKGLADSLRGMGTGSQPSNWEALKDVTVPVKLLAGELDEKFVAINQQMAEMLPYAELDIFPKCGHALHIEQPEHFQQALLEFAKLHIS